MINTQIAVFGEALFDRFPDGQQVLGGAPFNVAWHLQAFGQRPCFISRLGLDANGDNIYRAMQVWGMTVENLQRDRYYPTGTVQVTINNDEPHYEILDDQAYDFIAAQPPDTDRSYSVIYHGTLALRNPVSKQTLEDLTRSHQGKVFIDVNLRAPWWRKESVLHWVSRADWVKLNLDELWHLMPRQNTLEEAMRLFQVQHELEVLVVTCGSRGALAVNRSGEFFGVAPTADIAIIDTVGAGDAFAAVLVLGIEEAWPLQLAMERAQSFASALVNIRGATIQELSFYRPFIDAWGLGARKNKLVHEKHEKHENI